MVVSILLFFISAYFIGNINGAYIVTKLKTGQDIRILGSQNAGARNTGRVIGNFAFVMTVLIDALKTFIPLTLCIYIFGFDDYLLILTGLAVMLGHVWPVSLQFHGGRGVVVFMATTAFITVQALIPLILLLLIMLLIVRNFTISGGIGMLSVPVTTYYVHQSIVLSIGLFLLLLFVFYLLSPPFDKIQLAICQRNQMKQK